MVGPLHAAPRRQSHEQLREARRRPSTREGVLAGATSLTLAGTVGYVDHARGLVVLDLDDPLRPKVLARVGAPLKAPRAVAVQFRYAFVLDAEGLKVVDVTVADGTPGRSTGALVKLPDARNLYLARTYAYVAAGRTASRSSTSSGPRSRGSTRPSTPAGPSNDAHDVKVGMTNGSAFAYVADGKNGLRVVQLVSANDTPGAYGFSPRPTPQLVATYPTHGPALALSRGLDRDRAVDETGHQLGVFGRRGARPLNLDRAAAAVPARRQGLRRGQHASRARPKAPATAPGLIGRPIRTSPAAKCLPLGHCAPPGLRCPRRAPRGSAPGRASANNLQTMTYAATPRPNLSGRSTVKLGE